METQWLNYKKDRIHIIKIAFLNKVNQTVSSAGGFFFCQCQRIEKVSKNPSKKHKIYRLKAKIVVYLKKCCLVGVRFCRQPAIHEKPVLGSREAIGAACRMARP